MLYSPEKLKTHSRELMKFTQDHCRNLRDKNIVGMTRMHSQWHWCVFTIRPMPMFLVLCCAPHSFVLQHFWTVTVARMTQITWYWGMSLILGMERVQQLYHTHLKWNYRTNTIVFHLSLITNQIKQIHGEGGFWTTVMGRRVSVRVWIHLIAGDTLGHNSLVGHVNGGLPKYLYRDCKCLFEELSSPTPSCSLITLDELQ